MCGIVGTIGFGNLNLIGAMTRTLHHRGPDNQGLKEFIDPYPVCLGHTRLSILDLTAAGNQPMGTPDKKYWIVYNGEVYNFKSIREKLFRQFKIKFQSNGDTEVIIKGFQNYKTDLFQYLNGIFAFCIYDRVDNKIYLVRDHFGVKPLYYSISGKNLIFGSEIKAILKSGKIDNTDISTKAIWDFFTFLYVPSSETIFNQIKQVPPAHYLEYDLKSTAVKLVRYWEPISRDSYRIIEDYNEAKHLVRRQIEMSVKSQMVSDVPIGAFLSGGIDSSIVVGSMARLSQEPINTYTAVIKSKALGFFNEQREADRISKKFGTLHEEIEITTPKIYDVYEMAKMVDQPFGNPTLFLSHLISKGLRTKVKVAISGAGGDELFGGYVRYKAVLLDKYFKLVPTSIKSLIMLLISQWPNNPRNPKIRRVKELLNGIHPDFVEQYTRWTYFLQKSEKQSLLKNMPAEYMDSAANIKPAYDEYDILDLLNKVEWMDINSYLLNDILFYTDLSGMYNSLEIRVPLLDKDLVSLSLKIPQKFKIHNGKSKRILIDAFNDVLPSENIKKPKRGFSLPIAYMLSEMDEYFEKDFDKSGFLQKNLLNRECIDLFRNQHRARKVDRSLVLFALIQFDAWWQTYVKL